MSAAKRTPLVRRCIVCGVLWERPTYGWDAHPATVRHPGRGPQVLVDTCSADCRKKGGYHERLPKA